MSNNPPAFNITLYSASSLSPLQQNEVLALLQTVFGTGFHPEDWAPVDWLILISVYGLIVSHVSITDRVCDVGGIAVRVGGIGGVATLPDYRKRGFAHQAMATYFEAIIDEDDATYAG